MDISLKSIECLSRWVCLIFPKEPDISVKSWRLILRLIDLAKDSDLCNSTEIQKIPETVYSVLSVDVSAIVPWNFEFQKMDNCVIYSLLLLVLTMGLKLKCKLFMSAAFKLPATMHFCVVDMTKRLIEDYPITANSLAGLYADSENLTVTPVRRAKHSKIPLTCPMRLKLSPPPFTHLDKTKDSDLEQFEPDSRVFQEKTSFQSACSFPVFITQNPIKSKSHVHKKISCSLETNSPISDSDFVDSPLFSLKTILESPQTVSKGQFLSKLDEIRSLSTRVSELQHVCEENACEINRLTSDLQISEIQRKEAELRLKRREMELSELRDELSYELELRTIYEQNSKRADLLQERLNDALSQLKSMRDVSSENQILMQEKAELQAKLKFLEKLQAQIIPQNRLEKQLAQLKTAVHLANEQMLELLHEREKFLADSEAELMAKVNSALRNYQDSCAARISEKDSFGYPLVHSIYASSSLVFSQHHFKEVSETKASWSSESLAPVAVISKQLQDLECSLIQAQSDTKTIRRELSRSRLATLFAKALAAHRQGTIQTLQKAFDSANDEVNLLKNSYSSKLLKLENEVSSLESRTESAYQHLDRINNKFVPKITKLLTENKKLQDKINKLKMNYEETVRALQDQLNKRNLSCELENRNLEEKLDTLPVTLADEVKATKQLNDVKIEANMHVQTLYTKLNMSTTVFEELSKSKKELKDQINDQINANNAFHNVSENEIDSLRSKLSDLSFELKSLSSRMINEHLSTKACCTLEIKRLTSIKLTLQHEVLELRLSLQKCKTELETTNEQLSQISSLSESYKNDVHDLRSELSKTRERLIEVEDNLLEANSRVQELKKCNEKLENKVSNSKIDFLKFVMRIMELESDNKQINGKMSELKTLLESSNERRLNLEQNSEKFREQVSTLESQRNLVRQQLLETRAQLLESEQKQHEISLRLIRTKCNQTRINKHIHLEIKNLKCGKINRIWPPYTHITAPVSPSALKNPDKGCIYSGSLPTVHARRFSRFLVVPESEPEHLETKLFTPSQSPANPQKELKPKNIVETSIKREDKSKLTSSRSVTLTQLEIPEKFPNFPSRSHSAYDITTIPLTMVADDSDFSVCSRTSLFTHSVVSTGCSSASNTNSDNKGKQHKINKFWKYRKPRKRSKQREQGSEVQDNINHFNKPVQPSRMNSQHSGTKTTQTDITEVNAVRKSNYWQKLLRKKNL